MTFPAYGTYPTIGQPDDEPKKPSVPLSEIAQAQVLVAKAEAERIFGGRMEGEQARDNARRQELAADVDRSLPPALKAAISEAATAQASAEQKAQQAAADLRSHLAGRGTAPDFAAWSAERVRLVGLVDDLSQMAREAATSHQTARERYRQAFQQAWQQQRATKAQTLERTRQKNTERYNSAVLALRQLETDMATEDRALAEAVNEWDRLAPW
jgi:hypothetical protein